MLLCQPLPMLAHGRATTPHAAAWVDGLLADKDVAASNAAALVLLHGIIPAAFAGCLAGRSWRARAPVRAYAAVAALGVPFTIGVRTFASGPVGGTLQACRGACPHADVVRAVIKQTAIYVFAGADIAAVAPLEAGCRDIIAGGGSGDGRRGSESHQNRNDHSRAGHGTVVAGEGLAPVVCLWLQLGEVFDTVKVRENDAPVWHVWR